MLVIATRQSKMPATSGGERRAVAQNFGTPRRSWFCAQHLLYLKHLGM
jgi:hypothetical protein